MSDELKCCPFCGGEAAINGRFVGKKFYVGCKNCLVRSPYAPIKNYVITLWNTRHVPTEVERCEHDAEIHPLTKTIWCKKCHADLHKPGDFSEPIIGGHFNDEQIVWPKRIQNPPEEYSLMKYDAETAFVMGAAYMNDEFMKVISDNCIGCKGCPDCMGIVDSHTKEFDDYSKTVIGVEREELIKLRHACKIANGYLQGIAHTDTVAYRLTKEALRLNQKEG